MGRGDGGGLPPGIGGRGWRPGRAGDDRGASATEYLGAVIVMVAVVSALLATGVGQSVASTFRTKVCRVLDLGSCGGGGPVQGRPVTDSDFEPPLCQVSSISDKAGDKIKILFFEIGNDFGIQEQHFKAKTDVNGDGKVDGKDQLVYLTFTDAASVGAKKDFKPGLKLGEMGGGEIELGAGIKVTDGDTYVFTSEDEARKFRDDINTIESYQQRQMMPGGGDASMGDAILNLFGTGPLHDYEEAEKRVKDGLGDNRKITYGKVGLDLSGNFGLKVDSPDDEEMTSKLGGHVSFTPDVTWTNDAYHHTKSYTYSAQLQYGADATVAFGPAEYGVSSNTVRTGTITVTRDERTGKLLSVTMTQTIEGTSLKDKGKGSGDNGKQGKDKRGGSGSAGGNDSETGIKVVTNQISFDPGQAGDADRAVAQRWLDGTGNNAAPFAYLFGDHAPDERPGQDDPFGRLLFDRGQSSLTTYTGETNAAEYGFELNLGLSLGFSVSTEHKEETLDDARFLGAPRGDRRSYLPYSYCAN
ncbi:Flp family type IVb pilin [Streptomyces sp. TS71-3]|uniref:Flp family type IVb pilin n=1 Tax=Streptomyces sp. TS71-3 TaxID=2733862 RepID=UPI001B144C29|nr:hypothetical protein [Streptomyces sp. TS71-3]GHJ35344.1 hypothetical protein Sm713_09530 [Streptomyces sp. TS71-3]